MNPNHQLTKVLKGRTINGTSNAGDVMTIAFTDGSKMTIKTGGNSNSASAGGTVKAVKQGGTMLEMDLEVGGPVTITTAESTSCVMVRDGQGVMEYAD